jgi:integrase
VDALAEAMDDRYSTLIYAGAYLGLRWGELAGLKRPHLNLLRRRVKIVGSLRRVDNTYRYVEETKTVISRRMIPVPTFTTVALVGSVGMVSSTRIRSRRNSKSVKR